MSTQNIFCADCANKIIPIVSKKIDLTPSFSMTVFAISDYKDPLKKLILAKSWSDSLASHQMGQLLWEMTPIQDLDCDVIVPVPLHWTRYAWRGFNQAEEIARVISTKKQVPMRHLIKRCKKTVYQSAVSSSGRLENVKNAFELNAIPEITMQIRENARQTVLKWGPHSACNKEWGYNRHILLVDDLMTTGATLRAVGKVLLQLKPRKISVVVVCRVI